MTLGMRQPVVLVVDDDPSNLAVVRDCLVEFNYTVLVAEDGESAVQRADYARPDLILLDIMMPGIDGFETCCRLKAMQSTKEIPIIFMSALVETEHKVKGLEAGAVDYITKPFQREEVQARIAVHLHNRELTKRLQEAKELLEARVEARTAELAQTISALHDEIIQHKQTEEELRKSERHLRTLVQTIPDLIWLKDRDGVYLSCNRIFERFFGAKEVDIIGKTDFDFVDRELAAFFIDHDRKAIAAGEPTTNEEWVTFKDDGHHALLETIKTPMFDGSGTLIGVLGIGRDMSERKRAEEENMKLEAQLQQVQKMEAIGQLAGGVAHDFNNMLGVILGHVELVLDTTDPSEPQFSNLTQIRKAAERSADITRQLLAFARKQTVAPKIIDLNGSIAGMLQMLRRLIGENIDLIWNAGYGLWPVEIDPSQVDQILANLCVNARDAIAGVGKISVETRNSTMDKEHLAGHADITAGDYVRITVGDNGCGMDRGTLDHIFEPFFTTKGIGEGTGLGLATVYGAVKQNGGFVNVESEPGKGTTFTVYLPRHKGENRQIDMEGAVTSAAGGQETILLVEDEPAVLNITMIILQRLGYSVLTAGTPGEAVRLVGECPEVIDLLITDMVMPEMNGRDLAAQLLSTRPEMKCLFMSGYTAKIITNQGMLDEGLFFIQKPFTVNDLAAKVQQALAREVGKPSSPPH